MITNINEFAKKVAPISQSQNISADSLEIAMMKQAKKAGLNLTWVSVLKSMAAHHTPGNYVGITVRYETLPVAPVKSPRQSQEQYEAIVQEYPAEKLNQVFKDFIMPGMQYPQDLEFEYYGTDDHEYYTIFDLRSGIVITENLLKEHVDHATEARNGISAELYNLCNINMSTVIFRNSNNLKDYMNYFTTKFLPVLQQEFPETAKEMQEILNKYPLQLTGAEATYGDNMQMIKLHNYL